MHGAIAEELIRKRPAGSGLAVDWMDELLNAEDRAYASLILSRKLVTASEVAEKAALHPEKLFHSIALDVMLDRGDVPPSSLWNACKALPTREPPLKSLAVLLAEAFTLENKASSILWLADVVRDDAILRAAVITQLLRDEVALQRLSTRMAEVKPQKDEKTLASVIEFIEEFSRMSQQLIAEKRPMARWAEWTLANMLVSASSPAAKAPHAILQALAGSGQPLAIQRAAEWLRTAGSGDQQRVTVLTLTGRDLHLAVEAYLRGLSRDAGGDSASGADVIQRLNGKKDIITQILRAFEAESIDSLGSVELQGALFNLGVRPLCAVGVETNFDNRRHQTFDPTLLPGDPAVIVSEGIQIGDGAESIVLVPARVVDV